jgi:hypothetical protein
MILRSSAASWFFSRSDRLALTSASPALSVTDGEAAGHGPMVRHERARRASAFLAYKRDEIERFVTEGEFREYAYRL